MKITKKDLIDNPILSVLNAEEGDEIKIVKPGTVTTTTESEHPPVPPIHS